MLEDIRDEAISINGLARAIRVPANRISLIVNEKRGITADAAARLGHYFGTSAQYWLNIQNRFDLDSLEKGVIAREVIPKERRITWQPSLRRARTLPPQRHRER